MTRNHIDQTARLADTAAASEGAPKDLMNLGASRLWGNREFAQGRDTWVVMDGVEVDGDRLWRYLGEPDANGERAWGPLDQRGGFGGFLAAQAAIAQAGVGVAVKERFIETKPVALQPSGLELGL